jgi:hypothetical protein
LIEKDIQMDAGANGLIGIRMISQIPEPHMLALLAATMGLLWGWRRRPSQH